MHWKDLRAAVSVLALVSADTLDVSQAGEIFEEEKDEGLKDSGSLDSWLNQIQEKVNFSLKLLHAQCCVCAG